MLFLPLFQKGIGTQTAFKGRPVQGSGGEALHLGKREILLCLLVGSHPGLGG